MKLSDIERLQYKGSVELQDNEISHTVDIFYDPSSKAVYQVIRDLNKWRPVVQNEQAKKSYEAQDWSEFE
ncbi:hypothetical protein [Pseudobacteriovorax antillogorgiicola]|uniref:Uncharacterized protein n=1 Tax=Pseudobacteriovorax antillogorgiicola TaxID=1513793 RepID=A0A1Y6BI39_9BACT|nr:hypothetical protein [Pseudobacteriovorax antillogorgiicola]TCS55413.1 hypothetical protein EDD56_105134 [Pseudobacteriovorax antillogorgiicola]SMF12679.1 hypothetical protein SAMN06296036_105190 [Pseudobacteriovorax antillogorgiicola]